MRARVRHVLLPLALFLATNGAGCGLTESATLTPARKLEGTWKTTLSVPMTYATDFCGNYQNVSTSNWNVTMKLTAVDGYENVLTAEVTPTMSTQTRVSTTQCSGTQNGWLLAPPPLTLQMTVSSTNFTAKGDADGITLYGTYTTDILKGSWYRKECIIYCWGEASVVGQMIFERQK
jgi:hypothetical protein